MASASSLSSLHSSEDLAGGDREIGGDVSADFFFFLLRWYAQAISIVAITILVVGFGLGIAVGILLANRPAAHRFMTHASGVISEGPAL